MKFLVVSLCMCIVVSVRAISDERAGFVYGYETASGIAVESTGTLKTANNTKFLVIEGSYKYLSPDGTPLEITYLADENGYQPKGAHLPVSPPIPKSILYGLEYIASHPKWVDPTKKKNN